MNTYADRPRDPLQGILFAGRYRIERSLARSSMSALYQATDTTNKTVVAVKLLNSLIADQKDMQRFHREAQIARSLQHPNICGFLDHGVTGEGTPYHVLEYIDGQTLEDILAVVGALDPSEALIVFIKACRAAQYLHSRGIIHRDLKPENLMILNTESKITVKVIDFGIAKGTRGDVSQSVELTKPGEVFASLLYTAPERLAGQQADARSDIYSLGCIMYETLTGQNPFVDNSMQKIAERQARHIPESLLQAGVNLRVALLMQPIVARALDKNPEHRYQSAAELKDALERVEVPVRNAGMNSDVYRPPAKKESSLYQAAIAAVCIAVVLASFYAFGLIQVLHTTGWDKLLWL